jgi:hypothetical protein
LTLQPDIREALASTIDRDAGCPDPDCSLYSSIPPGKFQDSASVKPPLLAPTSFPTHHSCITLPLDTTYYTCLNRHEVKSEKHRRYHTLPLDLILCQFSAPTPLALSRSCTVEFYAEILTVFHVCLIRFVLSEHKQNKRCFAICSGRGHTVP